MAVVQVGRCLVSLMILYFVALVFAFLASVPMIWHVYPQSKCLLFSSQGENNRLFYGHYASCNLVAYIFLGVIVGCLYLMWISWSTFVRLRGHHPQGPYVLEKVPSHIMSIHALILVIAIGLTVVITAGYALACNNLHNMVSATMKEKLSVDPYDTRGEEIRSRYEDDYKFHRYTNRYGNPFGSEFFTIRISCRSIMTDPDIHQRLHDTHYELQSRYYGYWYGEDLFAYNSQYEATRTNALVEASMAGGWLTVTFLLAGFILIIVQRCTIDKKQMEQDRISAHSVTMGGSVYQGGDGSVAGSYFRRDGSLMSGKTSSFQRGGSRASTQSMRSRRDLDDLALNSILQTPTLPQRNFSNGGAGRVTDDVVFNNIASNDAAQAHSLHSSRETGYISDASGGFGYPSNPEGSQPYIPQPGLQQQQQLQYPAPGATAAAFGGSGRNVAVRTTADATYLSRDEMETEIF